MSVSGAPTPTRAQVDELSDAGPDVTRASNGDAKLERLRALKRARDPTNVFHLNHNIEP